MKNFSWIFGVIIILGTVSCSHTPKGIDPTPLYNLQLPDDIDVFNVIFDNDSVLAKKYNCQQKETAVGCDWWLMSISINDTNKYVGRDITILQFKSSHSDALEFYLFSKATNRIYKEGRQNKNQYFMAYEPSGIDFNHGIPFIGNYILLEFVFLINNYCIFISYTDFSATSKNVYRENINNDIILVSKMFNDVMLKYDELIRERQYE